MNTNTSQSVTYENVYTRRRFNLCEHHKQEAGDAQVHHGARHGVCEACERERDAAAVSLSVELTYDQLCALDAYEYDESLSRVVGRAISGDAHARMRCARRIIVGHW
jgi:hypothetical protein